MERFGFLGYLTLAFDVRSRRSKVICIFDYFDVFFYRRFSFIVSVEDVICIFPSFFCGCIWLPCMAIYNMNRVTV